MKVAIVAIAKDEDPYIEEWIEYNLKCGFSKIYIYLNDWDYTTDSYMVETIKIRRTVDGKDLGLQLDDSVIIDEIFHNTENQ